MTEFTSGFDRKVAGFSPGRVDALVWALTDLMTQPMKSWGIYKLYRQMAEEKGAREFALIGAPDPRQQREKASLAERSRFADIVAVRPATHEEAAEHTRAIDKIISRRPF